MVRRLSLILLTLAILMAAAWVLRRDGPERRIRRRFDELSRAVSRDEDEPLVSAALRAERLRSMLAPTCTLVVAEGYISGRFSRREAASRALQVISRFDRLRLDFEDLEIDLRNESNATTRVTALLRGRLRHGGRDLLEARDLHCELIYEEGEWLFSHCEAIEILRR